MKCPNHLQSRPELGPDCVDPEACQQGWPCEKVRNLVDNDKDPKVIWFDDQPKDSNTEEDRLKAQIETWWLDRAHAEVDAVAPKAIEYSAIDLIEYGRTLALVMGINHRLTDEEAGEIGIWGYLVGKIARWTGAIKEGRRVSDDTLHDVAVYTKMAQRNRDVGGWPFGSEEENR